MHEAYRPVSLLTALWPTQDFQFPQDLEGFARRLQLQFPLFNEAQVSPPPSGPPQPEWPCVILMGEQRLWTVELAPGKVSLRRAVSQPVEPGALFAQQHAVLAPLHAWLAENYNFRAYRIGTVAVLFCNTRSSANEKIANYFLHPRVTQGQAPYDVQLGLLNRINLYDNVMVNRWLRVRPLRSIDSRRVDFAAQVEVDVNTMPEDTAIRTAPDIEEFLRAVCDHLDHEIPILADGEFVE